MINEHNFRIAEPDPVTEFTPGVETPQSILVRFRSYDAFEKCNFSLFRLAIKLFVRHDLRSEVFVQHGHVTNFKKLPG